MNNIKYLLSTFALCLFLVGCEEYENSAEPSKTTFLPSVEINGASSIILDCNATSYEDAGVVAKAGTQVLDDSAVSFTAEGSYFGGGAADITNSPDVYSLVYSALNDDGIPGSAFRQVVYPPCNGDFVTSIAGIYTTSIVRIGGEAYSNRSYVVIRETDTPGTFEISDAFGGFYDLGRGFGAQCAAVGATIKVNDIATNDFDVTPGTVFCFGGPGFVISMENFTADAATKTINFVATATFANGEFTATMVQVPQ